MSKTILLESIADDKKFGQHNYNIHYDIYKFIDCFQYMFYKLGGIYKRLRSLSSLGRYFYGHRLCTCAMRLDKTFLAANDIMINAEVFEW